MKEHAWLARILLPPLLFLALPGCGSGGREPLPVFTLAWSEYPSWSVFGVADDIGLIDKEEGALGSLEEKWEVDIVLRQADYETCITVFAARQADAACLTNMDALAPALSRPSAIVLPTSTSHGADACLVTDAIGSVTDLKGKKVYGLDKSVSEYCFVRNLEILGEKESDYAFTSMSPDNAATAMLQEQESVEAIVVWNPFVVNILRNRSDVRVLFDSTQIPEEIIDAVVVGQDSLARPGGEAFACAVIDAFYEISRRIDDPQTADQTLIAIGEKFADLDLDTMRTIVEQTSFYSTPDQGMEILAEEKLSPIMERVVRFCLGHQMIDEEPQLGYGSASQAALRFDSSYIGKVASQSP